MRGRSRQARGQGPTAPDAACALIGRSPAIQALRRRIERVAPTEATVLILGERGTGKELVARAVAAGSPRRARPFIPVNCAALPAELLASELFGHERGAFTGATERRTGLLAAAAGGTVFLDEVGDLSAAGQAMLLRFLQEREVRPLGSTETLRVDIRVVAATNKDLAHATREGSFRADLHDRLSEVLLEVPPLRDRREDIPLLVAHVLEVQSRRHGVRVSGLAAGALRFLEAYDWPGNVRELEKAISRAVIFSERRCIGIEDLGLSVADVPGASEAAPAGCAAPTTPPQPGDVHLAPALRREAALRLATEHGAVTRRDLARECRVSREIARQELARLAKLGHLRRVGGGRSARYVLA